MPVHIVQSFTPFAKKKVRVIAHIALDPRTGEVRIEGRGGSLWHDYDERESELSDIERFKRFPFHFLGASFIFVDTVPDEEAAKYPLDDEYVESEDFDADEEMEDFGDDKDHTRLEKGQ